MVYCHFSNYIHYICRNRFNSLLHLINTLNMYKRSDYIAGLRAIELKVQDWDGLLTAQERRIRRIQTFKRVWLWFAIILVLGSLILALINVSQ